jgi:hypothetical protein
MTNYFNYNGKTYGFDENIKFRIDKAMDDYKKSMKSLKALENLGIKMPRDSREQIRFHLTKSMPSRDEYEIIRYIERRMSEIEVDLGIHNSVFKY